MDIFFRQKETLPLILKFNKGVGKAVAFASSFIQPMRVACLHCEFQELKQAFPVGWSIFYSLLCQTGGRFSFDRGNWVTSNHDKEAHQGSDSVL